MWALSQRKYHLKKSSYGLMHHIKTAIFFFLRKRLRGNHHFFENKIKCFANVIGTWLVLTLNNKSHKDESFHLR